MPELEFLSRLKLDGIERPLKDSNAVSFMQSQSLTEEQKATARDNIGAGTSDDKNFCDTVERWEALSTTEKDAHKTVDLTNDFNGDPSYDDLTIRVNGLANAIVAINSNLSSLSSAVNNLITTGDFTISFPRSTVEKTSGSYTKIGNLVMAQYIGAVTATQTLNDYITMPSDLTPKRGTIIGEWSSQNSKYGIVTDGGSNNAWMISSNGTEYNWGADVLNNSVYIKLIYMVE